MESFLFYLAAILATAVAQKLGYIENFRQSSRGDDWVELQWGLVLCDLSYPLHKYTLLTDDEFSNDVRCTTSTCTYRVGYLQSCKEHTFLLTPHFDQPTGGDLLGEPVNTTGFTNEMPPGAPTGLSVMSEDDLGTTIQWSAPSQNPECVHHYEVCSRVDGETETTCMTTIDTKIMMAALQACGLYHITITPVTLLYNTAPPLQGTITTRDDVPGPPQDVVVGLITYDTIQLLWNDPAINPYCVDRFVITYGETHPSKDSSFEVITSLRNERVDGYDNEATISPLLPCTNYTIVIYSQNSAELASEAVTSYAGTAETVPLPPTEVIVEADGPDSILVTWGENEDDRCAGSIVICWNDGIHPIETCEEVPGGGDNSFIITDLLPCSNYDVIVNVVSPNGNYSDPTNNYTTTGDVTPSPVVNLEVTDITANQLSISFDAPETHPQCVKEFDINIIDEEQTKSVKDLATTYVENTISGLRACTDYLVRVSAVSPTGKRSTWEEVRNTTEGATPSEPQELGVISFTPASITVQWFQPVENPRCVTKYELSWEGCISGSDVINSSTDFKMVYTVDGLEACQEYTFTLTARSDTGDSPSTQFTQTTDGCAE